MYSEMFPHNFVNKHEIKYVDIMIYALFAKAVVEVGYKVYIIFNNFVSLKPSCFETKLQNHTNESQEIEDVLIHANRYDSVDSKTSCPDKTYLEQFHFFTKKENEGLEHTNESQEIKDVLEGLNEDIIHTNRYDNVDSKVLSSCPTHSSCPDKTYLEQLHFFMKKENEGLSVETANTVTPWFNPSKRGPITMDLDNKLDTYKPFNNTSFEKVKAYDDDETLDIMTPTVSFVDATDTIIESNYENCIIEQSKQIKKPIENKIVIKIVPDHFQDIMTKNKKDAFTPSSSEYVNKKALQTLRHVL